MRRILAFVLGGLGLSYVVPFDARALSIDSFASAFPPNQCLSVTGAPVIFFGPYCDGTSCPPDSIAPCEEGTADQGVLPGVIGSAYRYTTVDGEVGAVAANARVRTDLGRVEVVSAAGGGHLLRFDYYHHEGLSLDLTSMTGIEIGFDGDLSLANPLHCQATMVTRDAGGDFRSAILTMTVTQPVPQVFPFALFTTLPGFSFADVDEIQIEVGTCPQPLWGSCGTFPARAYAVGPFEFASGPTALRTPSWGRLKVSYR